MAKPATSSKYNHTTSPNACQENEYFPPTASALGVYGEKPFDEWLASKRSNIRKKQLEAALACLRAGFLSRSRKIHECNTAYWGFWCAKCRRITRRKFTCKDRLCAYCGEKRVWKLTLDLAPLLVTLEHPMLLTLTIVNFPYLTRDHLTEIVKDFAKLRRLKDWIASISGGLYGLDFTWTDSGWNLHIHALLDGKYISRAILKNHWAHITRGSWNVDIRVIDIAHGVREVCKYITRGATFWGDPDLLHQWIDATKHRRFIGTFGSFRKAQRANARPPSPHLQHLDIFGYPIPNPPGPPDPLCEHCNYDLVEKLGYIVPKDLEPLTYQTTF